MSNPPSPLLKQLLDRVSKLQENFPSITQAQIAKHCGIGESNFSMALAGKRGLSSGSVLKLHQLLNSSRREIIAKFITPSRSSDILQLQERGKAITFDNDGWVPKEGSKDDPADSISIDKTDKAKTSTIADFLKVFAQLDGVARAAIADGIQKAFPNRAGTTAPNGQKFSR